MGKLFTFALTIAVSLGTTTVVSYTNRSAISAPNSEASFDREGAFRDGLYLGKLAAAHGEPRRPAIGRWSDDRDRLLFAAGYRRGYDEALGRP
jgi:hypothetical protein